ncbi:hypothetical protein [Anaerobiospirillum thomasii]|uniref:hypothetical protein n=1 Tax=Anaerobiospirillum thomasii TaxID=179995 RepID=UPI001C49A9ED|nr:hypothetical protein [Anaerobiospirillum thomasii]
MYQIAYIGKWESLPETAAAICDHDIPKLKELLKSGLDLNAPIELSSYIKLTALEIAVFLQCCVYDPLSSRAWSKSRSGTGTAPAAYSHTLL